MSSENYGAIATRLGRIPQSGLVQSAFCGEPQKAEFERSIIRERTKAGLAEARKAGRKLGRRFKLSEADRQQIVYLVREGKMTAADCARTYRIHESNISRLLVTAKGQG